MKRTILPLLLVIGGCSNSVPTKNNEKDIQPLKVVTEKIPLDFQIVEMDPTDRISEKYVVVRLINQRFDQISFDCEARRPDGQLAFNTKVVVPGNGEFELVGDAKEIATKGNLEALIFPGDTIKISSAFFGEPLVIKIPGNREEPQEVLKKIDTSLRGYLATRLGDSKSIPAVEVSLRNREKNALQFTCSVFDKDENFVFDRDFMLQGSGESFPFRDDGQGSGNIIRPGDILYFAGYRMETSKLIIPQDIAHGLLLEAETKKAVEERGELLPSRSKIKQEDFDGRKLFGPKGEVPGNDKRGNALTRPRLPAGANEADSHGSQYLFNNDADFNAVKTEYLSLKNKIRLLQDRRIPLNAGLSGSDIERWNELNSSEFKTPAGVSIFEVPAPIRK